MADVAVDHPLDMFENERGWPFPVCGCGWRGPACPDERTAIGYHADHIADDRTRRLLESAEGDG